MRYALTLLLLFFAGVAHAEIGDPIAHWKFDNDLTEEVASDDFVLTTSNAVFYATDLPFSGPATTHRLEFDSASADTATSSAVAVSGDWSFAGWIKLSDSPGGNETFLRWNGSGGNVFMSTGGSGEIRTNTYGTNITGAEIDDGQWHHVVITFDGTNSSGVKLYLDGSLEVSGTGTSTVYEPDGTVQISPAGSLDGSVDEYRIYDRELSSGDVTELYNYTGASASVNTNPLSLSIPGTDADPLRGGPVP